MKLLVFSFLMVFGLYIWGFTSCNNKPTVTYTPKYKTGDCIYFTQSGEKDLDTLFGQVDMGLLGDPILWSDSVFKYRVQYKLNSEPNTIWIYEQSIIRKK